MDTNWADVENFYEKLSNYIETIEFCENCKKKIPETGSHELIGAGYYCLETNGAAWKQLGLCKQCARKCIYAHEISRVINLCRWGNIKPLGWPINALEDECDEK